MVIQALQHTTMDTGLAKLILTLNSHPTKAPNDNQSDPKSPNGALTAAAERNLSLPKDIPGIWTAQEDQDLENGERERLLVLRKKHGPELVRERRKFLQSLN